MQHLSDALDWVARAHSFWNSTHGARHFMVIGTDTAQCGFDRGRHPQLMARLAHVTFVQV